jgi:hypothetical protein
MVCDTVNAANGTWHEPLSLEGIMQSGVSRRGFAADVMATGTCSRIERGKASRSGSVAGSDTPRYYSANGATN